MSFHSGRNAAATFATVNISIVSFDEVGLLSDSNTACSFLAAVGAALQRMLAAVEKVLRALRAAKSESEITAVLEDTALRFGFCSAYLVEYPAQPGQKERVLDSNPGRLAWWPTYFRSEHRALARNMLRDLGEEPVLHADISRFVPGTEPLRDMLAEQDLIDVVYVTMDYEGASAGVAGFCGRPPLNRVQEASLQLLAYAIFSQLRMTRGQEKPLAEVSLTPREKEVIALSADGLTSNEIATRLGMSARTTNQHIDNVADKLGTRNRAHTVAEVIRHNLLN